jgi:prepilin-type N-terminal cleavage/methylation domain-containing protein
MMKNRQPNFCRNQQGITLVELVIALVIGAIIAGATGTGVYQIWANDAHSKAHMTAIKQVENALHYISRDIQMAQVIQTDSLAAEEVLRLTWVDWDDNITYQVSYTLSSGNLKRDCSAGNQTVIAQHVTSFSVSPIPYSGDEVTVTITSTVEGVKPASETRIVETIPRSGS